MAGRWILRNSDGSERADIELDVQWEDWSKSSDFLLTIDGRSGITGLPLRPLVLRHGLQDTWSFRLGGAYQQPLGGPHILSLRGGVAYDTAALLRARISQNDNPGTK